MTTYVLNVFSTNTAGVRARLVLEVEAAELEEATRALREALPGPDWAIWTSLYGVVAVDVAEVVGS